MDRDVLERAAVEGMLKALGDRWSTYFGPTSSPRSRTRSRGATPASGSGCAGVRRRGRGSQRAAGHPGGRRRHSCRRSSGGGGRLGPGGSQPGRSRARTARRGRHPGRCRGTPIGRRPDVRADQGSGRLRGRGHRAAGRQRPADPDRELQPRGRPRDPGRTRSRDAQRARRCRAGPPRQRRRAARRGGRGRGRLPRRRRGRHRGAARRRLQHVGGTRRGRRHDPTRRARGLRHRERGRDPCRGAAGPQPGRRGWRPHLRQGLGPGAGPALRRLSHRADRGPLPAAVRPRRRQCGHRAGRAIPADAPATLAERRAIEVLTGLTAAMSAQGRG